MVVDFQVECNLHNTDSRKATDSKQNKHKESTPKHVIINCEPDEKEKTLKGNQRETKETLRKNKNKNENRLLSKKQLQTRRQWSNILRKEKVSQSKHLFTLSLPV